VVAYDALARVELPTVPVDRRIGMPEVELGYDEDQARIEAARCLQCFENVMLDPDLCILCGGCVDICPEHCIRILDSSRLDGLDGASAVSSVLVIQEEFCSCGLCAARFPGRAAHRGRVHRAPAQHRHPRPRYRGDRRAV
jgi:ferredoxin